MTQTAALRSVLHQTAVPFSLDASLGWKMTEVDSYDMVKAATLDTYPTPTEAMAAAESMLVELLGCGFVLVHECSLRVSKHTGEAEGWRGHLDARLAPAG